LKQSYVESQVEIDFLYTVGQIQVPGCGVILVSREGLKPASIFYANFQLIIAVFVLNTPSNFLS